MCLVFPPLYAIIDAVLLKTSALSFAEIMAESGVELLQYRHKHASSRELFDTSRALSQKLAEISKATRRGVRFIVNDRTDIAVLVRAGGVHVGQRDLNVAQAREIIEPLAPDCWVGVSTHTLEQVEAADRTEANYIAFGPVFPTFTKEHADPVVGLERLAQARLRTAKPLVAIGGVTLDLAGETYSAGADSLAVARDLMAAANPAARAMAFLDVASSYRRRPAGSSTQNAPGTASQK